MNIFLYWLQDFQNICTISRSLEFFWKNECYIYDNNNLIRDRYWKSYSRKIRTISAWAFEKINFIKISDPINFLKNYNWRKIATVLSENSESSKNFQFYDSDLVIFWSEATGIPQDIVNICNKNIMIPKLWLIQSLNVSHAVSLIIYEWLK